MVEFNTSFLVSLFLILLLSVSPAISASSRFRCHEKDADVLLKVKKSLGNPSDLSGWKTSIDCCVWLGVDCHADAGGRVTFLTIQYTDSTGTISPSVALLDKLEGLLIVGNPRLTGFIPRSIGKLKHLSFTRIAENPLLGGPIPKSLCGLSKLDGIDFHMNQLSGPIPGCLGGNLTDINFSFNKLTGSIPSSFLSNQSTTAPVRLNLYNNSLTGAIPSSRRDVTFDYIDLSENGFTDVTALLGEEKKITTLAVSNNKLAFDLSNVKFPLTLETLRMDHNRLTGRIPQQITKLEKLSYVDLSYNNLCGPIPSGGYFSKPFVAESFAHNKCLRRA